MRDHVEDMVVKNVRIIEGLPHHLYRYGWVLLKGNRWSHQFYIHPDTGRLTHSPRGHPFVHRQITKRSAFHVDASRQLHLRNGKWFMLTLDLVKPHHLHPGQFVIQATDSFLGRPPKSLSELWYHYNGPFIAIGSRELSEQEASRFAHGPRRLASHDYSVREKIAAYQTKLQRKSHAVFWKHYKQSIQRYRQPNLQTSPPPARSRRRARKKSAGWVHYPLTVFKDMIHMFRHRARLFHL